MRLIQKHCTKPFCENCRRFSYSGGEKKEMKWGQEINKISTKRLTAISLFLKILFYSAFCGRHLNNFAFPSLFDLVSLSLPASPPRHSGDFVSSPLNGPSFRSQFFFLNGFCGSTNLQVWRIEKDAVTRWGIGLLGRGKGLRHQQIEGVGVIIKNK